MVIQECSHFGPNVFHPRIAIRFNQKSLWICFKYRWESYVFVYSYIGLSEPSNQFYSWWGIVFFQFAKNFQPDYDTAVYSVGNRYKCPEHYSVGKGGEVKALPALKAHNQPANFLPILQKLLSPRRLTAVWFFTKYYTDDIYNYICNSSCNLPFI
jgi:hypothetical protein